MIVSRILAIGAVAWCSKVSTVAAGEGSGAAGPMAPTYQAQWQERPVAAVTRALSEPQLRRCAHYKYKRRTDAPRELLVRCTQDGRAWHTYLIYTDSETALGPYEPASAYD